MKLLRYSLVLAALVSAGACVQPQTVAGDWNVSLDLVGTNCTFVQADGDEVVEALWEHTIEWGVAGVEQSVDEVEAYWRSTAMQADSSSSEVRLSWTLDGVLEPRVRDDKIEFYVEGLNDTFVGCGMVERYWGVVDGDRIYGNVEAVSASCTRCVDWLGTFEATVDAADIANTANES